jgi:hypothetical protein
VDGEQTRDRSAVERLRRRHRRLFRGGTIAAFVCVVPGNFAQPGVLALLVTAFTLQMVLVSFGFGFGQTMTERRARARHRAIFDTALVWTMAGTMAALAWIDRSGSDAKSHIWLALTVGLLALESLYRAPTNERR